LHFKNLWNLIDIIIFAGFIASFVLRISWFVHPQRTRFVSSTDSYPDLDEVAFLYVLDIQVVAVTLVIAFLKVFKYFDAFGENMNILC